MSERVAKTGIVIWCRYGAPKAVQKLATHATMDSVRAGYDPVAMTPR